MINTTSVKRLDQAQLPKRASQWRAAGAASVATAMPRGSLERWSR